MKRRDLLKLFGLAPLAPTMLLAAPKPVLKSVSDVIYPKPILLEKPQGPILEKGFCLINGELLLIDQWPEAPTLGPSPKDWTESHDYENYILGMKRVVYDDTNHGWATLMYLYYTAPLGTVPRVNAQRLCCMDLREQPRKIGKWSCVTNVCSYEQLNLPLAVHIGEMVNARYGWFWVSGVCPVDIIRGLPIETEWLFSNEYEKRRKLLPQMKM